jgi:hypothetical protein
MGWTRTELHGFDWNDVDFSLIESNEMEQNGVQCNRFESIIWNGHGPEWIEIA